MPTLTLLIDFPNHPDNFDAHAEQLGEIVARLLQDKFSIADARLSSATITNDDDAPETQQLKDQRKSQPAFADDENLDVLAARAAEEVGTPDRPSEADASGSTMPAATAQGAMTADDGGYADEHGNRN